MSGFFSGKHFNTGKLFLTWKVIAFDAHTSVAASAETETRNWFTLERAFIEGKIRLSRNRDVGSDDVENYDDDDNTAKNSIDFVPDLCWH